MPFGTFWKHHVWSEDGSGYIFGQLNKKLATFLIHYLVTLIICLLISKGDTNKRDSLTTFKKNWLASFSLFSCFRQVTVKHEQCKNLPITGFKPLSTDIEKTHTVNYVTTTTPAQRERALSDTDYSTVEWAVAPYTRDTPFDAHQIQNAHGPLQKPTASRSFDHNRK